VSLKQAIEKQLGLPVNVKAGMPGALDIYADGERIYSKPKNGPLTQAPDIVSAIAHLQTA